MSQGRKKKSKPSASSLPCKHSAIWASDLFARPLTFTRPTSSNRPQISSESRRLALFCFRGLSRETTVVTKCQRGGKNRCSTGTWIEFEPRASYLASILSPELHVPSHLVDLWHLPWSLLQHAFLITVKLQWLEHWWLVYHGCWIPRKNLVAASIIIFLNNLGCFVYSDNGMLCVLIRIASIRRF